MKKLIEQLELLKTKYDIFGIKQSFEDEGVIFDDVITMRRITELCNLPLYVKIGGCEAKTDINNCQKIGVDTIIAPMVETPFALKKYLSSVEETSPLKLMEAVENGEIAAIIFRLKTKGKKRGYVERQELTGADNQPIITISSNL